MYSNTCAQMCQCVIILQFQSATLEVVSSFSPPVDSQSLEVSGTSTPPIDSSSPPPSQAQLSSAAQVEPASPEEFEVSYRLVLIEVLNVPAAGG